MSAYKNSTTKPIKPTPRILRNDQAMQARTINPALLTKNQRQKLWQGIQRDNPALADMLTNDETIKALKKEFDAFILFDSQEAIDYAQEPLELLTNLLK
jgi:hypothetical protein